VLLLTITGSRRRSSDTLPGKGISGRVLQEARHGALTVLRAVRGQDCMRARADDQICKSNCRNVIRVRMLSMEWCS
jgi:hypothetical protein